MLSSTWKVIYKQMYPSQLHVSKVRELYVHTVYLDIWILVEDVVQGATLKHSTEEWSIHRVLNIYISKVWKTLIWGGFPFIKLDGLQETGSPAVKVAEKQDIRCVLYYVSNHCMTTQIAPFTPNTVAVIVRKADGLAIGNFAPHSGG